MISHIFSVGLFFYVVWLYYKVEGANPVHHRKKLKQKLNQFKHPSSLLSKKGSWRERAFNSQVLIRQTAQKENIFRLHKLYMFFLNRNVSQFIFILLFTCSVSSGVCCLGWELLWVSEIFSLLKKMVAGSH